jgi:hypothetical protein
VASFAFITRSLAASQRVVRFFDSMARCSIDFLHLHGDRGHVGRLGDLGCGGDGRKGGRGGIRFGGGVHGASLGFGWERRADRAAGSWGQGKIQCAFVAYIRDRQGGRALRRVGCPRYRIFCLNPRRHEYTQTYLDTLISLH